MKGSELARNKISTDIDPLSLTKIQPGLPEKPDEKDSGNDNNGEYEKDIKNEESMTMLNIHL